MKKVKYEKRIVAFIDILGFKNMIKQDKDNSIKAITFIDCHLKHILGALQDFNTNLFTIKMFSDCISISCEATKRGAEKILSELSYMQLYFAYEGIFLRGAVSLDLHFENERMIFSKALVKSYEMEQLANYPRILVDSEIVKMLSFELLKTKKEQEMKYIMKAPDGLYYLDYLDFIFEDGLDLIQCLGSHKKTIIKQARKYFKKSRIIEKYKWLAEYHNVKCLEIIEEESINLDEIEQFMKLYSIEIGQVFPRYEKIY